MGLAAFGLGLAAFGVAVAAGPPWAPVAAGAPGLTIVVVDNGLCGCHPYLDHQIPWLNTPIACVDDNGASVPEFDYVWGGEVPGTGVLTAGRCQAPPRCPADPKKCSWPSYRLNWVAAVCAQGGPFTSHGPGGGQIGQPFGKAEASTAIVFSPTSKECNSAPEVLVSSVNRVSNGTQVTRVEVTTRCRQCGARK